MKLGLLTAPFPETPLLGRYTYLTIADLQANKPASYDRILNTRARRTKGENTSAWVGDEWMLSKSWQVQTGLRFDFSNPQTKPEYNHAADSVSLGLLVSFGGMILTMVGTIAVAMRLDHAWKLVRRAGGRPR